MEPQSGRVAFITVISAKSSPLLSGYKEAYFHMAKDMLYEIGKPQVSEKKKSILFPCIQIEHTIDQSCGTTLVLMMMMEFFILILSLKSNQVSLNHGSIT